MSGYIFDQIPQLKEALSVGDLESALGFFPQVEIEKDKYEYVALIREIQDIFISFYTEGNQKALYATTQLIAKSDDFYYTSVWPQYTDLISNAVAVIAEMKKGEMRVALLEEVLVKLPSKDGYVANHTNLNYNLACYYALNEDVKSMMEYVRRARFGFDSEKFMHEESFEKYKEEPFFVDALENIGYTMSTWWTSLWPIEEWYEDENK